MLSNWKNSSCNIQVTINSRIMHINQLKSSTKYTLQDNSMEMYEFIAIFLPGDFLIPYK